MTLINWLGSDRSRRPAVAPLASAESSCEVKDSINRSRRLSTNSNRCETPRRGSSGGNAADCDQLVPNARKSLQFAGSTVSSCEKLNRIKECTYYCKLSDILVCVLYFEMIT